MDLGVNETNPYLLGPYAPVEQELEATDLPVIGEAPRDFSGAYFRNGPNPRFAPKGGYHWFDGDGMVHAVHIDDGRVRYLNRYVQTRGLKKDEANGGALWSGLMEPVKENPSRWYKDTGNTDIVFHNRQLLATWYLAGTICELDPLTLETLGNTELEPGRRAKISAHPKVDPKTGELLFFDYGAVPPFMSYGVLGADGALKHLVPIDLPGPRLPHDMAFTENYSILMDLPVFLRPQAFKLGRWMVDFHEDMPSRFGIIPRYGASDEIRWFEADPCYVYHSVNAWEEGDEIVMLGCRVDDPLPKPNPKEGRWSHLIANLQVRARLHRWRFNLRTGETRQEYLDDLIAEFPTIDANRTGRPTKHAYHARLNTDRTLLFEALIKYDTDTGASTTLEYGPGRYGSEAPFAARENAKSEDDGYIVSFVTDTNEASSELWIIDALDLQAGPVARVGLPQRVPLGFHACWVDGDALPSQS